MSYQETSSSVRLPLHLNEEEAMALLEMCLLTEAENDPLKEAALTKLSDLCRAFLRAGERGEVVLPANRLPRRAFERMVRFRQKAATVSA